MNNRAASHGEYPILLSLIRLWLFWKRSLIHNVNPLFNFISPILSRISLWGRFFGMCILFMLHMPNRSSKMKLWAHLEVIFGSTWIRTLIIFFSALPVFYCFHLQSNMLLALRPLRPNTQSTQKMGISGNYNFCLSFRGFPSTGSVKSL